MNILKLREVKPHPATTHTHIRRAHSYNLLLQCATDFFPASTMNFQGATHSKLVQRKISSPSSADREFSQITTNDEGYSEIPIVLVPRSPILFSVALNIPSGPFVLWQKWQWVSQYSTHVYLCYWHSLRCELILYHNNHSRNMGQLSPGVRWIWPGWWAYFIFVKL